jgi:hypothetical protein
MADLRRMTAMRRGGRYGFTRHRGSHNDQRTRRIGNSCTKERAVDRRALQLGGSSDDHDTGVFSDSGPSHGRRHRRQLMGAALLALTI